MENFGCKYCSNRDTLNNSCMWGKLRITDEDLNIEDNGCVHYSHDDDVSDYYCQVDKQDLDTKDASSCIFYLPLPNETERVCATCEYFGDNLTPDTIFTLTK